MLVGTSLALSLLLADVGTTVPPPPPSFETAPAAPAMAPAPAPAPAAEPPDSRMVGLHLGIPFAPLEVDVRFGHFYGSGTFSLGRSLAQQFSEIDFSLAAGYTFAVYEQHSLRTYLDLLGTLNVVSLGGTVRAAVGATLGLRVLLPVGVEFGAKIPVLGYSSVGGLGDYYATAFLATAFLSVGYRF